MKENHTPPITYQLRRDRDSNMELFRIIAMFLVLVVHADFFSLGSPTGTEMLENPLSSFARLLFESLSIGCVNMFVLLSGWFGIRPKISSFSNFIFQCAFFLFGIYTFCLLIHFAELNFHGIMGCLLLLRWNWFIKAYLLLYILSPVLNSFIESSTQKQHRNVLICFFVFQSIFSWMVNAAVFFESGYSTISFIGLYLLARYFAKYKHKLVQNNRKVYLFIFMLVTIMGAIASYISGRIGIPYLPNLIFRYDSPLVIAASLSLLFYFSKLNIQSKVINWIGASSFAVFLLHTNPNLCEQYFVPIVQKIYQQNNGFLCILSISTFLILIYVVAILLDQIRKIIWYKLEPLLIARFQHDKH